MKYKIMFGFIKKFLDYLATTKFADYCNEHIWMCVLFLGIFFTLIVFFYLCYKISIIKSVIPEFKKIKEMKKFFKAHKKEIKKLKKLFYYDYRKTMGYFKAKKLSNEKVNKEFENKFALVYNK